jgi:hypothetical protein
MREMRGQDSEHKQKWLTKISQPFQINRPYNNLMK